ncbi:unnamed protein product [Rhodiola kirilowii]
MADQCKQMKKRPTVFTDLSVDELSCIFIIVAQSGAAEHARVMSVHDKHRQINGLISLAAEAGYSAAQYMFGQIILMSCEKLTLPLPISESSYCPDLRVQDVSSSIFQGIYFPLGKSEDQTFMSQLSSKPSCDNKGLYHYRFVKMFLSQCSPREFNSLYYHLRCYKAYCQKDSDRSRVSLKHMWKMCDVMHKYKYDLATLEWQGTHNRAPVLLSLEELRSKAARALLSLEELRSKALRDLDDIFSG